jgi:hypothetical protein
MFRYLIRSGVITLFVVALSAPAHALPLTGENEGFTLSLSQIWERFTSPIAGLFGIETSRAICDPNGGECTSGAPAPEETPDSRAICDPNGGGCNS